MDTRRITRPFEIKSIDGAAPGTFSGYGSVFGVRDSYDDSVERGAFTKSLDAWRARGALPAMLWQHKTTEPIGVYTAMREDEHGLYVEGRLLIDDDPLARRAYAHLKAGSLRGLSIGFVPSDGGESFDKTANINRLTALDLWEVSLVTFPANVEATVDRVNAATAAVLTARDCERALREAGFSIAQAKALMAGGFKALREGATEAGNEAAPLDAGDRGVLDALARLEMLIRAQ